MMKAWMGGGEHHDVLLVLQGGRVVGNAEQKCDLNIVYEYQTKKHAKSIEINYFPLIKIGGFPMEI